MNSYNSLIVSGNYCNGRNVGLAPFSEGDRYATKWKATGTKFAYKCARRLYDDFDPILSCNIIDVYGLR